MRGMIARRIAGSSERSRDGVQGENVLDIDCLMISKSLKPWDGINMVEDDSNESIETRLALYGKYGLYYPPQDAWRLYSSY